MKVELLTNLNLELDYCVANSEGLNPEIESDEGGGITLGYLTSDGWVELAYTGPRGIKYIGCDFIAAIIIRDGLEHRHRGYNKENSRWEAFHWQTGEKIMNCLSDDLLTSYKRCIVKRKYGEAVSPRGMINESKSR